MRWRGLGGVLGGTRRGPVVKRPPQTGPKQPAGGIERAPCCTDRPDSSDSSGECGPPAGRWEDLQSKVVTPPRPPHPTPPRSTLLLSTFNPIHLLTSSTPPMSLLSLCLHVCLLLGLNAVSQAMLKKLYSPLKAVNLNSCQCFVSPSSPPPQPKLLLLLFSLQ